MPGFNTIPGAAGGGGAGALNYVSSVHMSTYNRSWARAGTAGSYGIYSQNQENGYAYFVGSSMTTGMPMNRMGVIDHAFTSINIVAPQGDIISLYKVKVKSTTEFANPLASFTATPATLIASGSFVLPSNATVPFADIIVTGAGGASGAGHGGAHGGGGGGGGGNVVKVTNFPIYGSTIVAVGFGGLAGPFCSSGLPGGQSSFGPLYALGGGGGGSWNTPPAQAGAAVGNGGGGGGSSGAGAAGAAQTSVSGLGTIGSPIGYGGHGGGSATASNGTTNRAGGGGGSTGAGQNGGAGSGGTAGTGHSSSLNGYSTTYGPGGYGTQPNGNHGPASYSGYSIGAGGQGSNFGGGADVLGVSGQVGGVVVRFYTP
jgi:hypothetical protein